MNIWEQFVDLFSSALEGLADAFSTLGGHRWAAAIVVFTLIVRTLLLPLAVKQIRSMQGMQRLQPEIKRLQQKFKDDKQRLNQELMAVYQREGVNPLGSCLPLLAQFPILIAMFYSIRDLTTGEDAVGAMPFLGLGDLSQAASSTPVGWVLIVVMVASQFLTSKQMAAASPQQNRAMQLMPLFFVVFFINFPAGVVLYWVTQNVYQLVQQTIMLRGQSLPSGGGGAASNDGGPGKDGAGKGPAGKGSADKAVKSKQVASGSKPGTNKAPPQRARKNKKKRKR